MIIERECDWCGNVRKVFYTLCEKLRLCNTCEERHYRNCEECKAQDFDNMVDDLFSDEDYYNV